MSCQPQPTSHLPGYGVGATVRVGIEERAQIMFREIMFSCHCGAGLSFAASANVLSIVSIPVLLCIENCSENHETHSIRLINENLLVDFLVTFCCVQFFSLYVLLRQGGRGDLSSCRLAQFSFARFGPVSSTGFLP